MQHAQSGRSARRAAIAAVLAVYLAIGWFAWTVPFRDLLAPLRDAGWLKPVNAAAAARMQEGFGAIVMVLAAVICTPAGFAWRGWQGLALLAWPAVAFALPFAAGYVEHNAPAFWLSLLAGLAGPFVLLAVFGPFPERK